LLEDNNKMHNIHFRMLMLLQQQLNQVFHYLYSLGCNTVRSL